VSPSISGFFVRGDGKALVRLAGKNGSEMIVASQNKDSLKVFSYFSTEKFFEPLPMDKSVAFISDTSEKRKVELYYGSGFLSQSSRRVRIPKGTREIIVTDYKNQTRKIQVTITPNLTAENSFN
jgi:enediyne biosynthesis protein E4